MFDWSNSYAVNVQSIDSQHKTLFRLSADLHRAMLAGEAKSVLAQLLDRLVQYTAVHFAHEEKLMEQARYPHLQAHKLEHQDLTRKVLQFQEDFLEGRVAMAVSLLQFLKNWLEQHIVQSDHKYAPYLKEKSVA